MWFGGWVSHMDVLSSIYQCHMLIWFSKWRLFVSRKESVTVCGIIVYYLSDESSHEWLLYKYWRQMQMYSSEFYLLYPCYSQVWTLSKCSKTRRFEPMNPLNRSRFVGTFQLRTESTLAESMRIPWLSITRPSSFSSGCTKCNFDLLRYSFSRFNTSKTILTCLMCSSSEPEYTKISSK